MYVDLLSDLFEEADLPPPEYHTTREELQYNTEYKSILLCSLGAFGLEGTQPNVSYAIEEAAKAGWAFLRENFDVPSSMADDAASSLVVHKLREQVHQGRIPAGGFFGVVKARLAESRRSRDLVRQENIVLRQICESQYRNYLGHNPAELAFLVLSSS